MTLTRVSLVALIAMVAALFFFPIKASFGPEEKQEFQKLIHEYLVENPEVIKEALQALQKKEIEAQKQQAINTIEERHEDIFQSESPDLAPGDHQITLVEFFDYQCRYCKKMTSTVEELVSNNKDLRVVYKELPVLGGNSIMAAKAALAADMQGKYMALHKKMMSYEGKLDKLKVMTFAEEAGLDVEKLKQDMESAEVQKELSANMALAREIGIRGTPAFILAPSKKTPNKRPVFLPGAVNPTKMQAMIDEARK